MQPEGPSANQARHLCRLVADIRRRQFLDSQGGRVPGSANGINRRIYCRTRVLLSPRQGGKAEIAVRCVSCGSVEATHCKARVAQGFMDDRWIEGLGPMTFDRIELGQMRATDGPIKRQVTPEKPEVGGERRCHPVSHSTPKCATMSATCAGVSKRGDRPRVRSVSFAASSSSSRALAASERVSALTTGP